MNITTVYFDMDGVLADFDRGLGKLCGLPPHKQLNKTKAEDDAMWEAVKNAEHFYDRLEMMPGALDMFCTIAEKYHVEILTGIPKPKRGILTAGEDKKAWAHRLLSENVKVNVVFREEKKNFATGPDCILIDDLAENIHAWNEYGGTGILHTSAQKTLEELRKLEEQ